MLITQCDKDEVVQITMLLQVKWFVRYVLNLHLATVQQARQN